MRGQSKFKPAHGVPSGGNEPVTSHRARVNKRKSGSEFQNNVERAKAVNFQQGVTRGGIRL